MVNQRTVRSTPAAGQIQCLPSDLEPSDETSVQGGYDVQGQIDLEGDESCTLTQNSVKRTRLEKQWKSSGVEWKTALCASGPLDVTYLLEGLPETLRKNPKYAYFITVFIHFYLLF